MEMSERKQASENLYSRVQGVGGAAGSGIWAADVADGSGAWSEQRHFVWLGQTVPGKRQPGQETMTSEHRYDEIKRLGREVAIPREECDCPPLMGFNVPMPGRAGRGFPSSEPSSRRARSYSQARPPPPCGGFVSRSPAAKHRAPTCCASGAFRAPGLPE